MPSIPSQNPETLAKAMPSKSTALAIGTCGGLTTLLGIAIIAASIFLSLSTFQALPQGLNILTGYDVTVHFYVGVLGTLGGLTLGGFIAYGGVACTYDNREHFHVKYEAKPINANHVNH